MKRYLYASLLAALLALAACGEVSVPPMMHGKEAEEPEVKVVKMTDALFCFKCHSAARYEGQGGGFPHVKHKKEFGIDFHCNQCHEVTGHKKMKVIRKTNAPCSNCH